MTSSLQGTDPLRATSSTAVDLGRLSTPEPPKGIEFIKLCDEGNLATEIIEPDVDLGSELGKDSEAHRIEWHQLWLAVRHWEWTSLAIVPAGPTQWTMRAARSLARAGAIQTGAPIEVLDLRSRRAPILAERLAMLRKSGQLHILACPHPDEDETAIPLVLKADAILLAVILGQSTLRATQRVLQLYTTRVVGSVVLPKSE